MPFRFEPPTVTDGARFRADADATTKALFGHFAGHLRGVAVLKNGDAYVEHEFPYSDDITSADVAYLGGHVYVVDDTEAAALSAAGYGDRLVEL